MRGGAVGIAVALAVTYPAAAARADVQPNDVTRAGSATLMNVWTGPVAASGHSTAGVLVGWTATVGPGGNGGPVRLRAIAAGTSTAVVGDPVELPSAPGTYSFPAPHLPGWDFQLGVDQTVGGHAIVHRDACTPEQGPHLDLCQLEFIATTVDGATTNDAGARLTIAPVIEPDSDRDLRGDVTEDRTDLRVATSSTAHNGKLTVSVTLTNAGPLSADRPELDLSPATGAGVLWTGCHRIPWIPSASCTLDPLPAGASRTVTLTTDAAAAGRSSVAAKAEGPDLAPADNAAPVKAADPAVQLTAAKAPRGIALTLRSDSAGRVHVKLRAGGRITERTVYLLPAHTTTVTIHPVGKARKALQRASSASILVTRISGGSASAATKLKL